MLTSDKRAEVMLAVGGGEVNIERGVYDGFCRGRVSGGSDQRARNIRRGTTVGIEGKRIRQEEKI